MNYNFVINLVHANLNSVSSILNAIMTKYRFMANENTLLLESEPRDFHKIFLRF